MIEALLFSLKRGLVAVLSRELGVEVTALKKDDRRG